MARAQKSQKDSTSKSTHHVDVADNSAKSPQTNFITTLPNSAKTDFTILCQSSAIVVVVEDQDLAELFVTVHNMVAKSKGTIVCPVNMYAIRVVRTLFTFYKTIASLEYIKETAKGLPI